MSKIPPFYITQTMLGFGIGQADLNRIFLNTPDGSQIILCEMNEPRSDAQRIRWSRLADRLNELWARRS
jgi:hypothetical protein